LNTIDMLFIRQHWDYSWNIVWWVLWR